MIHFKITYKKLREFGLWWDNICNFFGDVWDWIVSHVSIFQSRGGHGQPEGLVGVCA
jgi:hypothetical protein